MAARHPFTWIVASGGALILLAVLGSCSARGPVPTPAPSPVRPAIRPNLAPASPPPRDWRDAPQTPGNWTWALAGGRSTASYGTHAQSPVVRFSCDRDNAQIVLSRPSTSAAPLPMAVYATEGSRSVMGVPLQGEMAVAMAVRDPLLDQIAFSRGRFAVELAGEPTLYLPAWPELSRVIEDCR